MTRDRKPIEPEPGLIIEEFEIPARDGYLLYVRSYRPEGINDKLPLLVYFHGGGWVLGTADTDDQLCRTLTRALPLLLLNAEYRLAPEHKFPQGWNDSYDVVEWCASEKAQHQLNTNLSKGFLVGGTSAGANFTAGIAHYARDAKLSPPITSLILIAGTVKDTDAMPEKYRDRILSMDEIDVAPGLSREGLEHFARLYGADPADKRRSPLLFDSTAGIAKKAVVGVCGWDPRRDEMLLFEKLLRDDGIPTRLRVYAGMPHGFWTVVPDLSASQDWYKQVVGDVGWLLE
ncbi:hypothetical protein LTR37_005249 [Vermiconidia calcicola]|uniref:Uncharacterized protein n=1 Tax=Vermiconidia calcicola TaxID=1690605 RepID=A0ACC3NKJ0_9PEZI|nr:hypothetical protein LTR37_005249 [Vermiconidia calcicola]